MQKLQNAPTRTAGTRDSRCRCLEKQHRSHRQGRLSIAALKPLQTYTLQKGYKLSATRHYGYFINSWPWEWFLTLTFREPVSLDVARRQLLHWNRDLCTSEGIQTAFIAVWNDTNFTPHWHALIFGKNKNGRTLLDVSEKRWERKWPGIARIEVVRGNQAASHYIAGNITLWNPDQYELFVYNKKLLNKYRRARQE